jgi:hypothetical protein
MGNIQIIRTQMDKDLIQLRIQDLMAKGRELEI